MNKTEIRNFLSQLGLTGVVTTKGLAEFLGLAPQTINAAKNAGKLHQLDRNCFDINSIVNWLFENPRHLTRICNSSNRKGE